MEIIKNIFGVAAMNAGTDGVSSVNFLDVQARFTSVSSYSSSGDVIQQPGKVVVGQPA
jgi:hypothetical protein